MTENNFTSGRSFPRCDMSNFTILHLPGKTKMSFAGLKNLSAGGICILTEVKPGIGDEIELEFSVTDEFLPVRVAGEVRWVRPSEEKRSKFKYLVGVQFLNVEKDKQYKIIKFVTECLKKQIAVSKVKKDGGENSMKTLLAIDGDEVVLKVIKDVFSETYQTLTARNAASGIFLARENKPDLIILDILMTDNNDIPLVTLLKNHQETSSIPILLITAPGQNELVDEAMKDGALDYLLRPISIKAIIKKINSIVK